MNSIAIVVIVLFALAVWMLGSTLVARLKGAESADSEIASLPDDLLRRIPVSLHPVIDPARCIGSAACVPACPEGRILRLHDGYAHLVEPESCIGHGACARECPVGAISLVFGTSERGIDIPHVSENFETNVPGIFIAGELGGMGLIRNAVNQGVQAVQHIAKRPSSSDKAVLDLLIVGAGPAGMAAALTAQEQGLRYAVIEQEDQIGGAIGHYPRRKVVMLGDLEIPHYRTFSTREMLKEELIDIWNEVLQVRSLDISLKVRMEQVNVEGERIRVATTGGEYVCRQLLLAIGRRGTPRKLGVPGEELSKVAYSLREPEAFEDCRILVVGGGDSAIEAAVSLSEVKGAQVQLSYRSEKIFRAKTKNRKRLEAAVAAKQLELILSSKVVAIDSDEVTLTSLDGELKRPNDQVFVFAGGVLPTPLLQQAGISMERKFGSR